MPGINQRDSLETVTLWQQVPLLYVLGSQACLRVSILIKCPSLVFKVIWKFLVT